MARRWIRFRDLHQYIGREDLLPDGYHRNFNRAVKKEVLVEIAKRFDIPHAEQRSVPALREAIRTMEQPAWYKKDKSPQSKFSSGELYRLTRALRHTEYVEAEDLDFEWDSVEITDALSVDGEDKEVTDKSRGSPNTEQPYDTYELYYFGQDERLAVLPDLDLDRCRYKHSVVLEKRRNDVPYREWKKNKYVKNVEHDPDYVPGWAE